VVVPLRSFAVSSRQPSEELMNTRTIAIAALVIAVILLILLFAR
jgi:hypothetical protein